MIGLGLFIPFFGTVLGSAAVFLMKKEVGNKSEKMLLGFAAGVMLAASVWSLLIPAIELSKNPQWLNAALGFCSGIVFLIISESVNDRLSGRKPAFADSLGEKSLLIFAVTLHNIPEGLAVGVSFAGAIQSNNKSLFATALALSLGIAIQNIPEGAIISMPLKAQGKGKFKSFLFGSLSGAVEPIAALLTLAVSSFISRLLPFLLSFAAGAMIYVCVNELIPESKDEGKVNIGLIGFSFGFLVMMILDVALG